MKRASMEALYDDYLQVLPTTGDRPNSESIDRLDQFYSPDLVAHLFMPSSRGGTVTLDRDELKDAMLQGAQSVKETMKTNQLVVDPDTQKMAAQQSIEVRDRQTGERTASLEAIAIYSLEQVEGSLKIVGLDLMLSDPGALPLPSSE